MTDSKLSAVQPLRFHPGEFINEELEERGWTVRDLVFRMKRYESEKDWATNLLAVEMYLTVHDPNVILGEEMAAEFSQAFGPSAEYFLNLHKLWKESL